jgi:hypothetical protein
VEFVAVLPLMALAALACVQALLLGLSTIYVEASADAAARSRTVTAAQLPAPGAWRSSARISRSNGRVTVTMRTPAVLPLAGWRVRAQTADEAPPAAGQSLVGSGAGDSDHESAGSR